MQFYKNGQQRGGDKNLVRYENFGGLYWRVRTHLGKIVLPGHLKSDWVNSELHCIKDKFAIKLLNSLN